MKILMFFGSSSLTKDLSQRYILPFNQGTEWDTSVDLGYSVNTTNSKRTDQF